MTDIDYSCEDYPYHVEMLKNYTITEGILHLVYENGKSSDFPLESIGLDEKAVNERLQYSRGQIFYVYQDKLKTQDIALERMDLYGCCSGSRTLLIERKPLIKD